MESIRTYSESLEQWWLEQLSESADEAALSLALEKLEPQVQKLSDLFTKDRPTTFHDYGNTREALMAYGFFYFPQSFVRARFPLAEACSYRAWSPFKETDKKALSILDMGSGLGAVGLSIAQFLQNYFEPPQTELTCLDHSNDSLAMLQSLFSENIAQFQNIALKTHNYDLTQWKANRLSQKYSLISFGFSLNEILTESSVEASVEYLTSFKNHLETDGLILILEPSLQKTASRLQAVSDILVEQQTYYSWGPYLNQHPCPLLPTGKFWNHEVRQWSPPASLEFINRRLFRSIHELKFSYTLLSPTPPKPYTPTPAHFRLVSPLKALKGRFIASGVASDGQQYTYDIPTRGLKKNTLKKIQSTFERGDILTVENLELLKQAGNYRIQNLDTIINHFHTP